MPGNVGATFRHELRVDVRPLRVVQAVITLREEDFAHERISKPFDLGVRPVVTDPGDVTIVFTARGCESE